MRNSRNIGKKRFQFELERREVFPNQARHRENGCKMTKGAENKQKSISKLSLWHCCQNQVTSSERFLQFSMNQR